jgi:hypothetical protein
MNIDNKQFVLRDISTIYPYERNAKKHGDEQVKHLAESIKQFGWRGNPILVDKSGVIIAGHGRRLAALSLGFKEVPVIEVDDMSAMEARAFRLSDNRVAISDIDNDVMKAELIDLDYDLVGIFDKKELDFAIADIMEMNVDAFESDLDTVMDEQNAITEQKVDDSQTKRVPIAKAIGVKDVQGSDVIYINRFMAQIQADSNLPADQAFVQFIKTLVGKISHE